MTPWRDSVTAQAQSDLDALLDTVVPLAQQHLARTGSFPPFAATVAADGAIVVREAGAGRGKPRDAAAALDRLYDDVRAERDRCQAAAFVVDVELDAGDAIRVELEHVDGVSLRVVMPYRRARLRRSVTYRPLRAAYAQPHVWAAG